MYYTIYLADCVDGDVRLQDGTDPSNGRVEVCQNGMWTSVCSSQFDQNVQVLSADNLDMLTLKV